MITCIDLYSGLPVPVSWITTGEQSPVEVYHQGLSWSVAESSRCKIHCMHVRVCVCV